MTDFTITHFAQYRVALTWKQALRALITRQPVLLKGNAVSPVIPFGVGQDHVSVECYGGGGSE